DEGAVLLDQRDLDFRLRLLQRAGATCAAKTATDYDDARRGLCEGRQWKRQSRRCGSSAADKFPPVDAMALAHGGAPYFCAASHAAIARSSSSENPLAMRPITVAGSEPSRNPVIAVMISLASRPYSRATDEAGAVPVAWHPEHDVAPGGAGEAAT